ncbi:hypothetical protein NE848_09160 [Gramella jeungdoensis]|uniref:Uncharacterized protein n=1 Tax=Gramella jeungdoensis TaxID=708091 RepID=A0ABT0Z2C9_9FLAO|nr:hypothetical protein [Gramella jeungdoensis]MCM8569548.1 hypothetical protein [Gramella jeungdoensis]
MQNPILEFYFQLAFEDKIQELKNSFLGNEYFEKNGYTYLNSPYDYYLKEEMVIDGNDPTFTVDSIDREEFFKIQLKEERQNLFQQINSLKAHNSKNALKVILDDLKLIYEEIESKDREDVYINIVEDELIKVIYRFSKEFSSIISYHPIFTVLKPVNPNESYFQVKDLKTSFFQKLHTETSIINLIDDVQVSEKDFIDVLTSPKPSATIRFIQPNYQVAYYLESIGVFFHNLNPKSIEKSKAFYNKQNKPIKKQDLYTALSRKNKESGLWKHKIDEIIEDLRDHYSV